MVVQYAEHGDIIHGAVRYWQDDTPKEVFYPCQERLHREMTINHPSVFVKKAVYDSLGAFDPTYRYAMDYELVLRFLAGGCTFHEVPGQVLANMRLGGASDIHWIQAARESLFAKEHHMPAWWGNRLYAFRQLARGGIRRFLDKMGMGTVINFYRRNLSIMRKE